VELFFFGLFGGIAVATAAYVVIARSPVNSAVSLVGTVLSLAGIYVLLNAHFLAVIQVLVYAGAIMVLFLFVIMLLNLRDEDLGEPRVNAFKVLSVMFVGWITVVHLMRMFLSAESPTPGPATIVDNSAIAAEWGGLESVGRVLMSDYALPFEITSVLLLVAMIGALIIARRRA